MRMLVSVLLAVFLAEIQVGAQSADDYQIVPGQRIGPIALGMSITDATKMLGTPHPATKLTSIVLTVPEGAMNFWWPPVVTDLNLANEPEFGHGFGVIVTKEGQIIEIKVPWDPRYRTAQGTHIGSRLQDVTEAFGHPSRQATSGHELFYIYDSAGIAFLIENNRKYRNHGLVNGIWVFAPRIP